MRARPLTSYWDTVKAGIREISQAGLDFVYPPACLLCNAEINPDTAPRFCQSCQSEIAPLILDACQRCGAPVGPNLETSEGCVHCRDMVVRFDRLVSLGVYKDLLRRACLAAKHHGTEPLTRGLGELLWSREGENLSSRPIDRVLSVPQHWTTRLWWGHNSSETLARFFAKRLATKYDSRRVAKVRRTPEQKNLPGSQRRRNLRDAFHLRRPADLKDENILIVDDVLTTGTTINRIARLLQKAKVRTITVAVIARGLGDAR